MKALEKFASQHNLQVVPITYKSQGNRMKRKGYDLIDNNRRILVSFTPVDYSNGDKWSIKRNYPSDMFLPKFAKRINKSILKTINPKEIGTNILK